MPATTVVVPAYNEAGRIGTTVAELPDEHSVLVVDDGSTDATVSEARSAGATVVEQPHIDILPRLKTRESHGTAPLGWDMRV